MENIRYKKFVYNLLSGMGKKESYVNAGFKARDEFAGQLASELLKKPEIREGLRKGSELLDECFKARMRGIGDDAIRELRSLVNNSKVNPATKLEAITRILDRIGLPSVEKVESTEKSEVTVIKSKSEPER